ncbi:MAG: T9SS type A sorting domain-containing protein [Luteibaculaceae bacterium]
MKKLLLAITAVLISLNGMYAQSASGSKTVKKQQERKEKFAELRQLPEEVKPIFKALEAVSRNGIIDQPVTVKEFEVEEGGAEFLSQWLDISYANGRVSEVYIYDVETSTIENRVVFAYSGTNLSSLTIQLSAGGNNWTDFFRTVYTFNTQNFLTSIADDFFMDGTWENMFERTFSYTFDAQNRVTQIDVAFLDEDIEYYTFQYPTATATAPNQIEYFFGTMDGEDVVFELEFRYQNMVWNNLIFEPQRFVDFEYSSNFIGENSVINSIIESNIMEEVVLADYTEVVYFFDGEIDFEEIIDFEFESGLPTQANIYVDAVLPENLVFVVGINSVDCLGLAGYFFAFPDEDGDLEIDSEVFITPTVVDLDGNCTVTEVLRESTFLDFEPEVPVLVTQTTRFEFTQAALTVNVAENKAIEKAISLFPNPVKSKVNISFTGENHALLQQIDVLDITGKVVQSVKVGNHIPFNGEVIEVNMQNLSTGVYFVRLQNNTERQVFKVIKE